ncbi:MAG: alkaline phosphatase [Desulfurococcaceae archaeon]
MCSKGILVVFLLSVLSVSVFLHVTPISLGQALNSTHSSSCPYRPIGLGPRNVILLIGDGMSYNHIFATLLMHGSLNLTLLNTTGIAFTYSADSIVTDSAAAATAMATGFRTLNVMVSMVEVNGVKTPVMTILELAKKLNMSTGLVTTTRVTHATPAAFAAHVLHRDMESAIATQLIENEVDVILGGGKTYFPQDLLEAAEQKGYTILFSRSELMNASINATKLLGLFDDSHLPYVPQRPPHIPSLLEMTIKAVEILERNPCGFFLMIEGGRIDHAAHDNKLDLVVAETREFDDVVGFTLLYAMGREDTLIVVIGDHETGGLTITKGNMPSTINLTFSVTWASRDHTAHPVPVFTYGLGADLFSGVYHLTDIARKLSRLMMLGTLHVGMNLGSNVYEMGDLNGNGFIDVEDVAIATTLLGGASDGVKAYADMNSNGIVDLEDVYAIFIEALKSPLPTSPTPTTPVVVETVTETVAITKTTAETITTTRVTATPVPDYTSTVLVGIIGTIIIAALAYALFRKKY